MTNTSTQSGMVPFTHSSEGYEAAINEIDESGIIPFADESTNEHFRIEQEDEPSDQVEELIDPRSMGESTNDEFGAPIVRRSVVDTDLGLDSGKKVSSRGARYSCPCCGVGARRAIRVRVVRDGGSAQWVALCAICAATMLARVPGTIVGGMIRPSRRSLRKANRRSGGKTSPFRRAG